MVGDWRSYDEIAERYDRVWSARFEAVARHIRTLTPLRAGDRVLDIGTGSGIVPMMLSEVAPTEGRLDSCQHHVSRSEFSTSPAVFVDGEGFRLGSQPAHRPGRENPVPAKLASSALSQVQPLLARSGHQPPPAGHHNGQGALL